MAGGLKEAKDDDVAGIPTKSDGGEYAQYAPPGPSAGGRPPPQQTTGLAYQSLISQPAPQPKKPSQAINAIAHSNSKAN